MLPNMQPIPVESAMAVLPLLADPTSYVACQWDLRDHPGQREYWLGLFRSHFPTLLKEAVAEAVDRGESHADISMRAAEAGRRFGVYLDELTGDPGRHGRLDILTICDERERILRSARIEDPYRLAKARENEAALRVLPTLLSDLDAMADPVGRIERLVRGMFAGNIFDLGATQTAAMFQNRSVDFHDTLSGLKPRPWLIDDLDRWLDCYRDGRPHRHTLIFVDNAGPDVVLGMIPFARDLLIRGASVILTANSTPTLNDVTHDELTVLVDRIAALDAPLRAALSQQRLKLVASGNGVPLIDMTRISLQLAEAMRQQPIDLLVIEGMGRAVESNLDARFTCDTLKLAMVKDRGVAEALGGTLYDLVLRFEPAGGP
jgi:damage-control phosphatase, subfamily II, stand-alone protein